MSKAGSNNIAHIMYWGSREEGNGKMPTLFFFFVAAASFCVFSRALSRWFPRAMVLGLVLKKIEVVGGLVWLGRLGWRGSLLVVVEQREGREEICGLSRLGCLNGGDRGRRSAVHGPGAYLEYGMCVSVSPEKLECIGESGW
jgi:hypothetical protein